MTRESGDDDSAKRTAVIPDRTVTTDPTVVPAKAEIQLDVAYCTGCS
jgi:hypothetical protein